MASIKLKGDTSGEVTISAPAVAGTTTLELPATSSTLATQNSLGVRNLIINGDMRIAQRGTSVSGITTFGYLTVDRWKQDNYNAGIWTMEQDTDVPAGQGFSNSLKMTCTTAQASLPADARLQQGYRIEGQHLQHLKYGSSNAEPITLSFWVKTNKTGTYVINLYDLDNSKNIGSQYTVSSANTWEKKTLTFSGNTSDNFDNDNNSSLLIEFWFGAGSDKTTGTPPTTWTAVDQTTRAGGITVNLADSTSNYANITGVQLEVGTEATPFEHRPYDMELQRCYRYYQEITKTAAYDNVTNASVWQTTNAFGVFTWLPMRASPTITATFTDFVVRSGGTSYNATGGNFANIRPDRCQFNLAASGLTVGRGAWYTFDTDAITSPPQKIAISAEL